MNGLYATNYVHGLQGTDARYIIANAGCKHFDAYGGPQKTFNAKVINSYLTVDYLKSL